MTMDGLFLLTLQVTARVTYIHITVVFYNEKRSEKEKARTFIKCVQAGPQTRHCWASSIIHFPKRSHSIDYLSNLHTCT